MSGLGLPPRAGTPAGLLRRALDADPARPLVTYYDDASGERVELSVRTFENWVAKTAGLLRDGLDVEPSERVALLLPPHWQTLVWLLGCWSAGVVAVLDATAGAEGADVVVTGPRPPTGPSPGARATVALALRPLGGPFGTLLPAGVLDHGREVLGYPDRFDAPPAPPDTPALADAHGTLTAAGLLELAAERAAAWGARSGTRLLTRHEQVSRDWVAAALLVPLLLDGSAVVCRHLRAELLDERVDREHVTAVIG